MALRLSIVTPTRPLVDAVVEQVVAPGSEGEFGVLPGHAALLAALKPGVVRWTESGKARRAAIAGGFAEVTQERVTVLAPAAELAEQIDPAEAQRRLADASSALSNIGSLAPPEQVEQLRDAVERAQARIDALRA
ncbi:MAG: ATP synthase F1 subunit epsilon [Solirubrobacteraceae bacterium]